MSQKQFSNKRGGNALSIVLVKPGATDFDAQGRITGSLDVPLSDSGVLQAQCAAEELAGLEITAIYSGPCLAAQQTSAEISADYRVRPRVEPRLKNVDMGLWQGRELDELKLNQPSFVRQWMENPEQICPPKGETLIEVRPRVDAFLKSISRKHKSGVVVVVVADPLSGVIADRIDMLDSSDKFSDETLNDCDNDAFGGDRNDALEFGQLRSFQLASGFVI